MLERYADLVAVGTIADVMPLIGENRYLVRRGLDCLNQFGWRYTLYVIRTGEYRRDEEDVYTVAESKAWSGSGARKKRRDVLLSSATHSIYESWIRENEIRQLKLELDTLRGLLYDSK